MENVGAGAEKFEEVAEDLELLADFVAGVGGFKSNRGGSLRA